MMRYARYKVPLEEARRHLVGILASPEREWLATQEALGRCLADRLVAGAPVPDRRIALRDGMAVAGDKAQSVLTGEPLPDWSTGLIKSEVFGQPGSVPDPRHVRQMGQDLQAGDVLFEAGSALGAWQVAALGEAGIEKLEVWRRPRVQVWAPEGGRSAALVGALLREHGAELVKDHAQLVIVTPGDRPGAYGRLVSQFRELTFDIWKVAIRPAKHVGIGTWRGAPLLLLPDHQVATRMAFSLFAVPALRHLAGKQALLPFPTAPTPPLKGEAGLVRLLWASREAGRLVPDPDQDGQSPLRYRKAEALLLVPPEGGEELPYLPLTQVGGPERP